MAEARREDEWGRTSHLLALLFNCNRDPDHTKAAAPEDFNPFAARRPEEKPPRVPLGMLKGAFGFDDEGRLKPGRAPEKERR
jgi:hypothetical protein